MTSSPFKEGRTLDFVLHGANLLVFNSNLRALEMVVSISIIRPICKQEMAVLLPIIVVNRANRTRSSISSFSYFQFCWTGVVFIKISTTCSEVQHPWLVWVINVENGVPCLPYMFINVLGFGSESFRYDGIFSFLLFLALPPFLHLYISYSLL